MAVKWLVDEDTTVEIEDGGIGVRQDNDVVRLTPAGANAAELVDALIAAILEMGWGLPDLSRHGYRIGGGE